MDKWVDALAYILVAVILGVFGILIRDFFKWLNGFIKKSSDIEIPPYVTHTQLASTKSEIYNDVTEIIEKTKNELATKESVNLLREDFKEVKKNVEGQTTILNEIKISLAVMAESQKQRRNGDYEK